MSTLPKNPTPTRRWIKPLMVAVPTFGLFVFFYKASEFTELDVSFIPKDAILTRDRYDREDSFVRDDYTIVETTSAVWKTDYLRNVSRFTAELKSKGYEQWDLDPGNELFLFFINENSELIIEPNWKPNVPETPENIDGIDLRFTYYERRPVQEKIKRLLCWLKNLK